MYLLQDITVCKQDMPGLHGNKFHRAPGTPAPDIDMIGVALESEDTDVYEAGSENWRIGAVQPWGAVQSLTVSTDWTIQFLKQLIQALTGICCERQQLTYAGKVLPSHVTVLEAGLRDSGRVNLVVQPCKLAPALLQLYIKPITDVSYAVWMSPKHTIQQLKEMLHVVKGPNPEDQRLVFAGQQLDSEHRLCDYGLKEGYTLYLLVRKRAKVNRLHTLLPVCHHPA